MTDEQRLLRQAVTRALSAVKMLLGRGRIILTGDNDAGPVQIVQAKVTAKETMDLPRLAEFGFASRVPKNGDCVIVYLNGERTWGIVVATGHQKARMHLQNDGEVAIHDAFGEDGAPGKWIWAKKAADDGTGGGWEVEANGEPLVVNNAKKITLNTGADGLVVNAHGDVVFNMNGHAFNIEGASVANLAGTAGAKKLALDQDPVVANKVNASSTKVTGK